MSSTVPCTGTPVRVGSTLTRGEGASKCQTGCVVCRTLRLRNIPMVRLDNTYSRNQCTSGWEYFVVKLILLLRSTEKLQPVKYIYGK